MRRKNPIDPPRRSRELARHPYDPTRSLSEDAIALFEVAKCAARQGRREVSLRCLSMATASLLHSRITAAQWDAEQTSARKVCAPTGYAPDTVVVRVPLHSGPALDLPPPRRLPATGQHAGGQHDPEADGEACYALAQLALSPDSESRTKWLDAAARTYAKIEGISWKI